MSSTTPSPRYSVKLFFQDGRKDPTRFVPIFHHWIQRSALPLTLIDVADYSHVVRGPGVLLVAHEGQLSIDEEGGKQGLQYDQKRGTFTSEAQSFRSALLTALTAAERLVDDEDAVEGLDFARDRFVVKLKDKLAASVTDSGAGEPAWVHQVKSTLADAVPETNLSFVLESDAVTSPTLTVTSDEPFRLERLVQALQTSRSSAESAPA